MCRTYVLGDLNYMHIITICRGLLVVKLLIRSFCFVASLLNIETTTTKSMWYLSSKEKTYIMYILSFTIIVFHISLWQKGIISVLACQVQPRPPSQRSMWAAFQCWQRCFRAKQNGCLNKTPWGFKVSLQQPLKSLFWILLLKTTIENMQYFLTFFYNWEDWCLAQEQHSSTSSA